DEAPLSACELASSLWMRSRRDAGSRNAAVGRDVDPKPRAAPLHTGETNGPVHELREPLGDDESDPSAFDRPRLLSSALKRLKQLVLLVLRDPHAGVRHRDAYEARLGDGDRERDAASGPVVLDGVRTEIHQNLDEPRSVDQDHGELARQRIDADAD